ncbi:serine hydrolase domain-containing protein [Periweissella ghanensis]|uniref:Beta-lactamase-related domain-containing protein n=1 Tax=Periweissella ghanensis TaxID=467997 RepID=A0ABN8BR67_9LACO|nr:serine hydrolase [Periweissella ghanensis]MCM0601294.1 serine hydrolase [Periweissella ghanensis]CAH0419356.1 hypothetical protein WGH24286_01806 [Periweissella ghanensis]
MNNLLNIIKNKKYQLVLFALITLVLITRWLLIPVINNAINIGDTWQSKASEQAIAKVKPIQKINFSRKPAVLQAQLHSYLAQNHLNAVAVTTVTGSKVPMVVANGNISNFSNDKLDENSVFQIASIQKIFTAIIIQRLIEEGELNLRTPIDQFYPNIPYGNKITVWNLLTHTSGIVDGNYKKIREITNEQEQVDYVRQHLISTRPHYVYSSANFSLLAGIIMQVTNQSYKQNVTEDILQPLGLNNTYFYQDIPEGTNLVYPNYVKTHIQQAFFNYDIRKQMSLLIGAGQIYSTPADYFEFLTALMEGKLIPKKDFPLFFPVHNHDYYNGLYSFYGNYQAGGSQSGYNLSFVINPITHAQTVVFSSNYMLIPNKTLASEIFVIANRKTKTIHWLPQY